MINYPPLQPDDKTRERKLSLLGNNLKNLYQASGSLSFSDSLSDRENARQLMQTQFTEALTLSEELGKPRMKDILQRFAPLFSDMELPSEERRKLREEFRLAIDFEIRKSVE